MFTLSISHIALSVKDVTASIEFYQKVLHLKEIKNTASTTSKTRWLSLGEGKQLHLIHRPDFEIKVNKAIHLALATPDMNAVVRHLEKLKIEYSDWLNTPNRDYLRKDKIKQVYFQDPNGYWIEINDDI